ncbi:NAD-dependent epimerase/dehydratase family protein [Coprobacter fastidiosus]|uniref:NAD-dependent epimerase/dehydratase family protein n=1 Tax=Coprobacter fastidiosus TaxID=1099853 RepID=UPI0032082DDF
MNNKNILLLGGFGFIGTNILKYVDSELDGYTVTVFDKLPKHPYGVTFNCVKKVYAGDFGDTASLRPVFENDKFDFIIHAISSTVPATSSNFRYDIESNLIATIELLRLLVEYDQKNIIYLSSGGAIYGKTNEMQKHKEIDSAFPLSSYGIVKLAIEKYLSLFYERYQLRPLILRLSNPFGPYHFSMKQGIVNVALRSAKEHKSFVVWGDGKAKKDYIFINDFCDILFKLIEIYPVNEIINIGSSHSLSVNDILKEVSRLFPTFVWSYKSFEQFDVPYFELDTRKLLALIGDYQFTPFEEGLLETKNWLLK